jgi:hypothetical protein
MLADALLVGHHSETLGISEIVHRQKSEFDHELYIQVKPVSDRDHEVLGMGTFEEYTQLYGNIVPVTRAKH